MWCTDGDERKEFRGILIEGIGRFSGDGPMSFNYLRSNYSTEESGTGAAR